MNDQPSTFLSKEELFELTGRRRPGAICRALTAMGFPYVRGPGQGGLPCVARAYMVARMVTGKLPVVEDTPGPLPDFGVFQRSANDPGLQTRR